MVLYYLGSIRDGGAWWAAAHGVTQSDTTEAAVGLNIFWFKDHFASLKTENHRELFYESFYVCGLHLSVYTVLEIKTENLRTINSCK